MSIILLLVTTALTLGFFQLIGESGFSYIPIIICGGVIAYGIRLLYRNTNIRKHTILPYIQKQGLRLLISIALIWSLYTRITTDRSIVIAIILNLYAGVMIRGIIDHQKMIRQQSASSYTIALFGSFIASQTGMISFAPGLLTRVIVGHFIIGTILAYYRRGSHPTYTDTTYSYLTYLGYLCLIALSYEFLPFMIAAIMTTIIIGYTLVSLPTETIDVTPDEKPITAEDILDGQKVLETKRPSITYDSHRRLQYLGIQPDHGTLLIRIIIGTMIAAIIYEMNIRYTASANPLSFINSLGFIILIMISIIVCVLYYVSHRQQDTITLRKITTIILTNIAIGISAVHFFYTDIQMVIIVSMIRNTINNLALWRIYNSRYSSALLSYEYRYWMITNIIITITNSILILTNIHLYGRQTVIIILCGYWGVQGLLLYNIYSTYLSHYSQYQKVY